MATTRLNPYLQFKTNAREAMEFYKSIFGGKLTVSTFKDFGMAQNPADENLVMHSMLEADNGITFMGSDTPSHMTYKDGARVSIALSGDNNAELTGYFEKLASGGSVTVPLNAAPWGDAFGMLTDRYGFDWLVNIAGKKS